MDYFVKEIQTDEKLGRTAGVKARDDVEQIFSLRGMEPIEIPSHDVERKDKGIVRQLYWHWKIISIWKKKLNQICSGDSIVVQFPVIEHSLFQAFLYRWIKKRNIRIVLLIHDLELLRVAKRKNTSFLRKIRLYLEEKSALKYCTKIIVHNTAMKNYIEDMGVKVEKIVVLQMFDYLIPGYDSQRMESRKIKRPLPVIIAGTLRPHKAQYAYCLPENLSFNLYGVGYEGSMNERVAYHGSYSSEELPYVLEGSFGLVWDGDAVDTCAGVYGDYLKINNPHKASLYLAAEIPVIVWRQSALAPFVKENECGVVIDSLYEIEDVIMSMTDHDYEALREHTKIISKRLREGYYTQRALDECIE